MSHAFAIGAATLAYDKVGEGAAVDPERRTLPAARQPRGFNTAVVHFPTG